MALRKCLHIETELGKILEQEGDQEGKSLIIHSGWGTQETESKHVLLTAPVVSNMEGNMMWYALPESKI